MKKSGTGIRGRQSALPAPRHLPLVAILVDAQAELQELVVASGLKVLAAMLEADRVAVCGPRYAHQPAWRASRAGHAPSEVVLGGRKVALRRPRVRRDGQEVALPSVQAFTNTDPLTRRVVEQMLIGVAATEALTSTSAEPLAGTVPWWPWPHLHFDNIAASVTAPSRVLLWMSKKVGIKVFVTRLGSIAALLDAGLRVTLLRHCHLRGLLSASSIGTTMSPSSGDGQLHQGARGATSRPESSGELRAPP